MKKVFSFLLFIVMGVVQMTAQNKNLDYNRNSISVLFLSDGSGAAESMARQLDYSELTDKFNYNVISKKVINCEPNSTSILATLDKSLVPAMCLNSWRSVDALVSRARYNLTDKDVNLLRASARGIDGVKDEKWFSNLLRNNYILVIKPEKITNFQDVQSVKEFLDMGFSAVQGSTSVSKTTLEGFYGRVHAFLFRIEMGDKDYFSFFENWSDDRAHSAYHYSLVPVTDMSANINGTQRIGASNSLLSKFVTCAVMQSLEALSVKTPELAVNTTIVSKYPITAKIGLKEGLYPDQPVFVYKAVQKPSGKIVSRKMGVLKVKHIADNRTNASGNSSVSSFYKANWGIYKPGMYLIPKSDKGIAVNAGASIWPYRSYNIGTAINFSKLLNDPYDSRLLQFLVNMSYTDAFSDSNDFFSKYADMVGDASYASCNSLNVYSLGVGLLKVLPVFAGVSLCPYGMLNLEDAVYDDKDMVDNMMGKAHLPFVYGKTFCPEIGVRLPVNLITYHLQLVPYASYIYRINATSCGAGMSTLAEDFEDSNIHIIYPSGFSAGAMIQISL